MMMMTLEGTKLIDVLDAVTQENLICALIVIRWNAMNVMTNGIWMNATVTNATLLPVAIAGMKVCTIVLVRAVLDGVTNPDVRIADSVNVAMAH